MRGKGVWAILSALALLALSSKLGAVWEFRLLELQAVPGQQNLVIPVYGTAEDSMVGFQFQIAFCEDEDSMKIWVDSMSLKGYGKPYTTLFDTLDNDTAWFSACCCSGSGCGGRSYIEGGAWIVIPNQHAVSAFEDAILCVLWARIEPVAGDTDTIELDLTEDLPCPPGYHLNCIFTDAVNIQSHHADLVDGAIYIVTSPIYISVDPPGPYSMDEGGELMLTVSGTSENPNDQLQLLVLGGLEPWMDFSPGPTGNPTMASLTLHPGYCDDGTYVVELGLSSTAYDITIMRPETIEVNNANSPPLGGKAVPEQQEALLNGIEPIQVRFYDLDLECDSSHARDSMGIIYKIDPTPSVMPQFEDHGDGTGELRWLPTIRYTGDYVVRFLGTDKGGESAVCEARIHVVGAFSLFPIYDTLSASNSGERGFYLRSARGLRGLYLEVEHSRPVVYVRPGDYVSDLEIRWEDLGGVLRVWVWRESGEPIPPGEGVILTLDGGDVELLKVEELEDVSFERFDEIKIRPNPSEGTVMISYSLPHSDEVEVSVYDATGKFVRRLVAGEVDAGRHVIEWDGRDYRGLEVGSGLYFIKLEAGDRILVRKLIMLR